MGSVEQLRPTPAELTTRVKALEASKAPDVDAQAHALASEIDAELARDTADLAAAQSTYAKAHWGLSRYIPLTSANRDATAALAPIEKEIEGDRAALKRLAPMISRGTVRVNEAAYQRIMGRYREMGGLTGSADAAAAIAIGATNTAAARERYTSYLKGQYVGPAQAALLTAATADTNADTGTVLADYRSFVRYDGVGQTNAALFAALRLRTGADIAAIGETFKAMRPAGDADAAALLTVAVVTTHGNAGDALATASKLRNTTGLNAADAALLTAAAVRAGASYDKALEAYTTVRAAGADASDCAGLAASVIASGKRAEEVLATYKWFGNETGPGRALVLTAGWALEGSANADMLTSFGASGLQEQQRRNRLLTGGAALLGM